MTSSTGPLSPRSTRVTAARRLLHPKDRRRERLFLVEGPQAVREALDRRGDTVVRELFVSTDLRERHADLVQVAADRGIPVHEITEATSAALTETVTPQGLVAVCRYLDEPLASVLASAPRLVVVLVQVRDPGNAGAVVRVADAAGAGAVVCTDGTVDVYNGKCVRASTGSLFHLPLVTGAPLPDAVDGLRAAGLRVLAADGAGDTDLDAAIDSGALCAPTAWLFGNEAWGLPPTVRALADDVVRVPLYGRAESLNLATAAALCLYASARELRR